LEDPFGHGGWGLNTIGGRLDKACARPLRGAHSTTAWPLRQAHYMSLIMEDMFMRQFDFAPLYRSTVGFDRLAQLMDSVGGVDADGYPPYNIERLGDNQYRITMAVAGFARDEFKIEVKEATLIVTGEKKPEDKQRVFLHRGIAARSFERRFQLADHVEVKGADFSDGLLHIDLVRNLPERMKPRTIAIGSAAPKQIEATA
jgi:molecular chaperone IbpA